MKIRPEEITSILRKQIEEYDVETDLAEVGTVLQVGDGIARIYGLESAVALEMLELEHGVTGLAFNLEEDNVGAALFGEWEKIKEGDSAKRTGRVASIPVGDALIGRIVDPLGNAIDGGPPIETDERRPLEFKAPGVVDRQPVKEPLQTGIKAIDTMTNVGRGQRELIIGDRSTGKTAILVDTILNQRDQDVICIYVAIGQKAVDRRPGLRAAEGSRRDGLHDHRHGARLRGRADQVDGAVRREPRWASTSCSTAATPSACTTTCRSTPTRTARCRCSSAARPAARPSRATSSTSTRGCSSARASSPTSCGAGSLTALPVIETQAGDMAAYIPTNVISITDGQIFLEADLFFSGVRPAVNVGRSVSRVGASAQTKAMKKVARAAAARALPVPRARGVRAVRLRARRGDAADARPRRADGRDAQPAAVRRRGRWRSRWSRSTRASTATSTTIPVPGCRASRTSSASTCAPRGRSTRRSARPATSRTSSRRS